MHRASWIGYAISNHLLKDYSASLRILEEFRNTLQVQNQSPDFEYSELLLYQNMVMREAGQLDEALEHIDTYKKFVCDKVSTLEIKSELYMLKGDKDSAAKILRDLIQHNPENKMYYLKLEEAMELTSADDKLNLYKEFTEK